MTDKRHSDLTNLPKGIFDSLNGVVWKDDRQIKKCFMQVVYSDKPGVFIEIEEI
jgi:Holliday junction resolvase RusA-like endonuclease